MTTRRQDGGGSLFLAESALCIVHVVVAVGFVRLFDDKSFIGPLVAMVVVAHVLSVLCRRVGLPTAMSLLVAVVGLVVAATHTLFGDTTAFGLPTATTWDTARDAIATAGQDFDEVIAPTPALDGFLLLAGIALSAAVWFGDWAAFRLRTSVEALAPATVIFVFCALLGSGRHRLVSAGAFAAAALLFLVAQRAWRSGVEESWLTDAPKLGPRSLLRTGAVAAGVALLAGLVLGPMLPGAGDEPMVQWRRQASRSQVREAVSPIVDLKPRLVSQSDTPFFQVRADQPAYWRLAGLDEFDGRIWKIESDFTDAQRTLPSAEPGAVDDRRLDQEFRIQSMKDIWVPAAFEPRTIDSTSEELSWHEASSTLIVAEDGEDTEGMTYRLTSAVPTHSPAQLTETEGLDDGVMRDRYTRLPADFPQPVVALAQKVTGPHATSRYEKMRALQDWFREFDYTTDIAEGTSVVDMESFLTERRGYCEQFAGTYAAMARSLGVPARVAIGFTPGDESSSGVYQVRGRHAHAWPEVYFPTVGWVPFEPTPGRGMPGASSYTGVRPQQDDTGQPTPASTTTSTSTPTTVVGQTTTPRPAPSTTIGRTVPAPAAPGDGGPSGRSPLTIVAAVVTALALLWAGLLFVAHRVRRRRRSTDPSEIVLDAWRACLRPVRRFVGAGPRPAETHAEFGSRVGADLGPAGEPFNRLAALATVAAWSERSIGQREAARATELAELVITDVETRLPRWKRWLDQLSPRRALLSG